MLILVSSQTGFSHHLRYVLPAFPFAFVWISKVARAIDLSERKIASLAALALAWSVASSTWVYPHSLSHFNELVGGPKGGPNHLAESNADWGQDLLYLRDWLEAHPNARPLYLAYVVPWMDPRLLGIAYAPAPVIPRLLESDLARSLPGLGPQPGWYAVSVGMLYSRRAEYAYLLRSKPVAMAGYSIWVYHLGLEKANALRREQGLREVRER